MSKSIKVLSDITIFSKYAKHLPELDRRETWKEIVARNEEMNIKKYPHLEQEIKKVYKKFVLPKKVLMSMRSAQFAGKPIELTPSRVFNCCYAPIDDWRIFSEIMFLLLGGTGVGFSVQTNHVDKLPEISKPTKNRKYVIADSIEGWSDAVKVLCKSYFLGKPKPRFIFDDIRPKGAQLVTSGGKAPGPQPLKDCLHNIEKVFETKSNGEKLTTLECHDIVCYIADAVLAGGIRRAALISLFDMDDDSMLTCKFGNWWELNPQRGRANNSAMVLRHKIKKDEFLDLWKKIEASGSGEPGIYLSNNADWGTNPSLRAGTRIYTTEGIFPIEELQDREFTVKNLNGELSQARCWLSGKNKQLYKITLQGNHVYYATPEHEWAVKQGDKFVKVRSDALEIGQEFPFLRETHQFDGDLGTFNDGFFIGWQLGDGGTHLRKDSNVLQHNLIVSKIDGEDVRNKLTNYIENNLNLNCKFRERGQCFELTTASKSWNNLQEKFGYKTKKEGLPKSTWKNGSEDFRKGLISALFSSDGCVSKNEKRITFTTKYEKLAEDVSDILGFYGIKTTIKRSSNKDNFERFDVKISENYSLLQFKKLFTLIDRKQEILNGYKFPYKVKNNNTIKIIDIELSDVKEDVWDISVKDETHCFQLAHSITGNCCEIALRPYQFCNLTEINMNDLESQEDLNERAKAAAFLGTLQAGYTDFHYLRDIWRKTTERDALIGVSGTGIASRTYEGLDLTEASKCVVEENKRVAELIGIKSAARTTCIKPAGTTSLVLGTSSGIHAWYAPYYIRRMRVGKNEALYSYISKKLPELVEDCYFKPTLEAVISVPIKAPAGGIFRDEPALELLERIKKFSMEWVKPGHNKGENTHNVSATVSLKEDEWKEVGEWMWKNRDCYNGLAVLPYDGGTYKQAPFEEISKSKYYSMEKLLKNIDLTKVVETEDETDLKGEVACAGGACSI